MPTWTELLPFAVLGLSGALHCAGMCGGFALAVTAAAPPVRRAALTAALAHVLGKALCYAVLGAAVAGLVQLAAHEGARLLDGGAGRHLELLRWLQLAAAWVGGALFVAFALSSLGLLPARVRPAPAGSSGRRASWLGFLVDQTRALPRSGRGFATGVVNGLLPCGLTASALALAGAGGPARGALGMFLFGLATGPVLVVVGLGGRRVGGALRSRLGGRWARVVALLALGFGLLTVARGVSPSRACGCEHPAAALEGRP